MLEILKLLFKIRLSDLQKNLQSQAIRHSVFFIFIFTSAPQLANITVSSGFEKIVSVNSRQIFG